ncbi:putative ATP-dependent helicase [Diplonema papillatum]|nr:putative ATP-dependent helicase [Diplonema papillatum]
MDWGGKGKGGKGGGFGYAAYPPVDDFPGRDAAAEDAGKRKGKTRRAADGSTEAKCKDCRSWEPTAAGTYAGRKFHCGRCCAKRETHDSAAGGERYTSVCGSVAFSSDLAAYRAHWGDLVDEEWAEEVRVVEERIGVWPLHQLVARGYCLPNMAGRPMGRYFAKTKLVFSSADSQGYPSDIRVQFAPGDEVMISRRNPLTERGVCKAEVVQLAPGKITVACDAAPADLKAGVWRIDAGPNKTAYDRTKAALNYTTAAKNAGRIPAGVVAAILQNSAPGPPAHVPEEPGSEDYVDIGYNPPASPPPAVGQGPTGLNASQQHAITAVLNPEAGHHRFLHLIQGPPGTGKTTTTAELIRQYVGRQQQQQQQQQQHQQGAAPQRRRVLVAADSNVAADQLLARCVAGGAGEGLKVVRVGASLTKIAEDMHEHTLLYQLETHPMAAEMGRIREQLATIRERLYGGTLSGKAFGLAKRDQATHMGSLKRMEQQIIDDCVGAADVVCATLVGCGSDALLLQRFSLVVIDEASMATEPRCLIAVQKLANDPEATLILVGDQRQLPPVVLSGAAAGGLNVSLFDRIVTQRNEAINTFSMLTVQYRMHSLLRAWPSHAFYQNRLLDGVDRRPGMPGNQHVTHACFDLAVTPLVFIDTSGVLSEGEPRGGWGERMPYGAAALPSSAFAEGGWQPEAQQGTTGSKYNDHEVAVVEGVLRGLACSGGGAPLEIGVISPYAAQVGALGAALRGRERGVEVKTVDGFQGREKDVIVFSCVRTDELGFLSDCRRLNVAITRAKRGLIIVGDSRLLCRDMFWASLIRFVGKSFLFGSGAAAGVLRQQIQTTTKSWSWRVCCGGPLLEIGVISPYAAQVGALGAALRGREKGVEVKTVDGFQGREKDVIVFSCVRTDELGFLSDCRRLNVAITRAKRGLIIVGDSRLLCRDMFWASLIRFVGKYRIR